MVEPVSPLLPVWKPGPHGRLAESAGVVLTETRPGSIAEVTAWPGKEASVVAAIRTATGLALPEGAGAGVAEETKAVFTVAPRRFLVVDQAAGTEAALARLIGDEDGVVTALSHGRTAIRISGARAEWVLAKFFAIDFSPAAFPVGAGRSTAHHDVFAQIQRTAPEQFDLYVFRSFARSFWTALCHGAAEVGYEVR
ncbi:sarcosine oxidase subunit gamma family protein [Mesorhizobium sp. L-8-3]|uniref:sarcosine oxidase subunit gamma family protein n=1 Tax=Mesorhizobium sp. L-8-3 TaxID=2744522 RepID=UPI0019261150|nr:sarcosine oxidase subunit gamma family protein [Mesorhizobium sp. L-8-3]BCH24343.1 sarcosine oxidase subunit gamma [Mesorhizobium sp. L-8-3]